MRGKAPKRPPSSPERIGELPVTYTVAQVATRHQTGREQGHRWIRAGDLAAVQVARLIRVTPESLADFERRHLTDARGRS